MRHAPATIVLIIALATMSSQASAQTAPSGLREISRYALTLFAIDNAVLGPADERLLIEEILPDIHPTSVVTITGYTDVIGLEDRNLALSRQRAEGVAKRVRREKGPSGYQQMIVRGVGESSPLYSNQLPEGRFLNRTVQIEIDTRF